MATSKSSMPALDLGDEVVGADEVGAGGPGLGGGVAGGEHRDPDVLAGAGGQGDGAADQLVGLAGVDAEPDGQLDGLVELGRGQALHQVDGLGRRVQLRRGRTRRGGVGYCLPVRRAIASALDRDAHGAGGAGDLLLGRLEVVGVEVGHLRLGDLGRAGRR